MSIAFHAAWSHVECFQHEPANKHAYNHHLQHPFKIFLRGIQILSISYLNQVKSPNLVNEVPPNCISESSAGVHERTFL